MKKKFKSAEEKKAYEEHQKWLRSRGIKPPTRRVKRGRKANIEVDLSYRSPTLPSTSDSITGIVTPPSQDRRDKSLVDAINSRAATVAPSFNKGPLQPQTNLDLFESKRR